MLLDWISKQLCEVIREIMQLNKNKNPNGVVFLGWVLSCIVAFSKHLNCEATHDSHCK